MEHHDEENRNPEGECTAECTFKQMVNKGRKEDGGNAESEINMMWKCRDNCHGQEKEVGKTAKRSLFGNREW